MGGPSHKDIITFTPHIASTKIPTLQPVQMCIKAVPTCLCVILDPASHLLLVSGIFFKLLSVYFDKIIAYELRIIVFMCNVV